MRTLGVDCKNERVLENWNLMLDIFMTAFELYTMMWSNKSFWKHKSEFFDLYLRHNETQQAKFTNGKEYTY